ncbi:MAG TPA: GPW/gp25 family protein [Candidatus Methylomirabilis sp.]|nr:GPW/gp25 family protein [Candidatus Methylomirabilis sp.]
MGQDFLGVGWKFPVRLSEQGEFTLSRYEEDIRESIWIILSTAPGERLMRPDFGCGIHEFVFAPNTTRTAGLVRQKVEEALNRWEPRIEVQEVRVEADPDSPVVLLIHIAYRVRATDSRFNLVYPFYLEREGAA